MWTNDKRRRNINDPLNSPLNVSERMSRKSLSDDIDLPLVKPSIFRIMLIPAFLLKPLSLALPSRFIFHLLHNVSLRSSFYIRKLRVISLKVNATHSLYVHPCHSCDCVVVVRVCPWGVNSGTRLEKVDNVLRDAESENAIEGVSVDRVGD